MVVRQQHPAVGEVAPEGERAADDDRRVQHDARAERGTAAAPKSRSLPERSSSKYRGTFVCAVNAELRLARYGSSSDIFVKPHGAGAGGDRRREEAPAGAIGASSARRTTKPTELMAAYTPTSDAWRKAWRSRHSASGSSVALTARTAGVPAEHGERGGRRHLLQQVDDRHRVLNEPAETHEEEHASYAHALFGPTVADHISEVVRVPVCDAALPNA